MAADLPTESDPVKVVQGDCLDVLRSLPDGCVDAVVTDPPYGMEFMGKEWDSFGGGKVGTPGIGDRVTPWVSNQGWNGLRCRKCGHLPHGGSPCECPDPDIRVADDRWSRFQAFNGAWASAALRVLKPGGYLLAFGGTRTYHRLTCAVEDAGFEVRDCLNWLYGTGFPKGPGCLKPAWEPVLLARRPGKRVLPLGIDECRVGTDDVRSAAVRKPGCQKYGGQNHRPHHDGEPRPTVSGSACGRYPANVLHDGSDEVLAAFAAFGEKGGGFGVRGGKRRAIDDYGLRATMETVGFGDSGSAARFFYCAKASKRDRGEGNTHPTVKPTELMRWLVRLVARPGEVVLDPFGGSGSTGVAARLEGRRCLLIERESAYAEIARRRIDEAMARTGLFAEVN